MNKRVALIKKILLLGFVLLFLVSCTDGDGPYIHETDRILPLEGVTAIISPDKELFSIQENDDIILTVLCEADFSRYRDYEYSFYCYRTTGNDNGEGIANLLILEDKDDEDEETCIFTRYSVKEDDYGSEYKSYSRNFHLKPLTYGWYYLTVYFTALEKFGTQKYSHSTDLLIKAGS